MTAQADYVDAKIMLSCQWADRRNPQLHCVDMRISAQGDQRFRRKVNSVSADREQRFGAT